MGGLDPEKHVDELVRAFALARSRVDAHLPGARAAADVCVNPGTAELQSIVALEALRAQVVASRAVRREASLASA